jgi:hypothetical protein
VYTLTEEGRKELESWLRTPARLDLDLRNETYLKLMLAWRLSRTERGRAAFSLDPFALLDRERRTVRERLHEVTEHRARAEKEGASVPTLLMLDLAILRLDAFHQWLDRCEQMFRGHLSDDKGTG